MKRLPNLDALRFLLVLLVVCFHVPLLCRNQGLPYYLDLSFFNRGVQAVNVFFVLSGFLIINQIYSLKLNNKFSIKEFYIKRVLRILPLYYLVVILGYVFYNIVLPFLKIPFEINYNLKQFVLHYALFLPNVFEVDYMPGGILEVLWSIGIEEQFYIIIAPVLFVLKRRFVLSGLVILTVISFVLFHLEALAEYRAYNMYYFLIFFGGVIAVLEVQNKLSFLKNNKFVASILLVVFVLYLMTDLFFFDSLMLTNAFAMVLFGLVIHGLIYNNCKFEIKNRGINYFGKISYGIYMYHVFVLNAVVYVFLKLYEKEILNDTISIILINGLTLVLSILVAHFSYTYFELPILRLKRKFIK